MCLKISVMVFPLFYLLCWAVTGPFSTLCALISTKVEEAGAGFCVGSGPASLERLVLLVVANA